MNKTRKNFQVINHEIKLLRDYTYKASKKFVFHKFTRVLLSLPIDKNMLG